MKFLPIIFALVLNITYAGNEGGGGDSGAIEVQEIFDSFQYYLNQNPIKCSLIKCDHINKFIDNSRLVNGSESVASVQFVDDQLFDEFGVNKEALFNTIAGTIIFNRQIWHKLSIKKKYELVIAELLGLSGITSGRYAQALELTSLVFASQNDIDRLTSFRSIPSGSKILINEDISVAPGLFFIGPVVYAENFKSKYKEWTSCFIFLSKTFEMGAILKGPIEINLESYTSKKVMGPYGDDEEGFQLSSNKKSIDFLTCKTEFISPGERNFKRDSNLYHLKQALKTIGAEIVLPSPEIE